MDDLEVIGCVAAIISTYDEGLKALETIREQWSAGEHAPDHEIDRVVEQLKDCIKLDATAILESYDNNYKQSGRPFAGGDQIAKNGLKKIIFELQQSLIKRLQSVLKDDGAAELTTLKHTSDRCRARAITILEELHQRLKMASKVWPVSDPPNTPNSSTFSKSINNRKSFESYKTNLTVDSKDSVPFGNVTSITTSRPTPQANSRQGLRTFIKNTGSQRSKASEAIPKSSQQTSFVSSMKNLVPKLSAIAYESTNGCSDELVVDSNDKAASTIRQNRQIAQSRPKSIANVKTTQTFDKDLWLKPWEAIPPPPPPSSTSPPSNTNTEASRLKQITSSTREVLSAPIKRPTASTFSGNSDPDEPLPGPTEHWPSPANNFAGFCKGSYKLQQDIRGAMRLSFRPIGTYTYTEFWKCQKCLFEGVVHGTEQKKGFDTRVHEAPNGLLYRWVFLAKSHAFKGRYGGRGGGDIEWFMCIFCAAEGIECDALSGKENLMEHLKEWHTEPRPREEVLERTRCVVGRRPEKEEYFELCIPPRKGAEARREGQIKPDVVDSLVPNTEKEDLRVVGKQEMEAEMLAGQGATEHFVNGHTVERQEPTAQVVANEGPDAEEVDVRVVDGKIEAVQMVTGQLEDVTSEDFKKMFDKGMKVSEVC